MDTTTAYAEIVKAERNAEGDLVVVGKATGPDLDLDQQICDPEWLKTAMPAWMSSGGNIREQHSSIAAGVATELEQNGDSWMVTATVVDPVSARKVEKGVLKGFSIGIRNPRIVKDARAPGGIITGGTVVETSLVDRPANPTCMLLLAKMAKPGPTQAEVSKGLVRVEELHDRSAEPLAALKALGVDVGKGDPARQARDIAGAQDAIACIACLIQSEAQCLADGALVEAVDIDLLLDATRALGWFITREKEHSMAHVALSADPATTAPTAEVVKGDGGKPFPPKKDGESKPAEDSEKEELDADGKPIKKKTPPKDDAAKKAVDGEQTDLTELVKAAVAEATAPILAQLAKAMEQPAPGGPVLTRTQQDTTKAAAREHTLNKAAEYERRAYELNGLDRDAYLELAAQTRATAPTS